MKKLLLIVMIVCIGCIWGCDADDSSPATAIEEIDSTATVAEKSIPVATVKQNTAVDVHDTDNPLSDPSDQAIFLAKINEARANGSPCAPGGLSKLVWDEELAKAALAHSGDMAANNSFSHTGSDQSSFWDRVYETDFAGIPLGENIGAGYDSVEAVVNGWTQSQGHCLNIMNAQATHVGYAMVVEKGTQWTYYATMVLGAK